MTIFAEAKKELGIHRAIRLVESEQIQSPAIMGLFRPALLLPADVHAKFDSVELRLIFLHELAHLKRGDVIVQGLIALLQIIHWFNPVLWFAFRRMRADREPATDALVLSHAGEAEKERYGLMLIKLLEHFNQRHSLPTLVGILEDKDEFKRRFSLIARFTRGAYGWSLLGALLIVILIIACLTKSKAGENSPQTSAEMILHLGRFVDGVNSIDYSETRGDPRGDHSYIRWQEMKDCRRIEVFEPSLDTNGKHAGIYQNILSYDGTQGYDYTPGSDHLRIQKEPFQDRMEGESSGLEGPLLPFEFLDKRETRSSSGRVTLQTLKSPDALAAVAARAVLAPDQNRSWNGHPCIAVRISGGNDRFDSQAPVDFVAYFATDGDFYPVAYEIYKHGKLSQSYWVVRFATVSLGGQQPFRYPALAKGIRYDSDTYQSSSGGSYSFDLTAAADLKINTLAQGDFTMKPPAGGFIEDLDSGKLVNGQPPLPPPTSSLVEIPATPVSAGASGKSTENGVARNGSEVAAGVTVSGWVKLPQPDQVDFLQSGGNLIAADGERHDFTLGADGSFTIPQVGPGIYTPEIRVARKVVLDGKPQVMRNVKRFNPVTVASVPYRLMINWDDPVTPVIAKGTVEIDLKICEIDESVCLADQEKLEAAVKKADIGFLNQLKGATLLSAPSVTTKWGQRAVVEIVREFPFATRFKRDAVQPLPKGPKATTSLTPTEFETAEIGVKSEFIATEDNGAVQLNGKLSVTDFDGFTESNVGAQEPTFRTVETRLVEDMRSGELKGVWIPGARFDEETITEHDDAGKVTATMKKIVPKRMIVFLIATAGK